MIKTILKTLKFLRPLFIRFGINFEQMLAIVSVKLTIDNRIEKNGNHKTNSNHTLLRQAVLMCFMGTIFFVSIYLIGSLNMALLIFHSYLCIVVITSFMSEYSHLLFNSVDNTIVERFPISNRTLLCARIISMLSYLYLLTFSLSIFPYLLLIFKEGFLEAQLFLLAVLTNTLFSLLLANLFYIILIKFLSVERFQKIITYVQTLLVIGVAFSYQLISQLAHTPLNLTDHPPLWTFFTPPCYFVSFITIFRNPGLYTFLLFISGVGLTFLLLYLTLNCFSTGYITKASALGKMTTGKSQNHKEKIASFLSRLCCHDLLQQSGFMLTWRMTRDNLKFKQSIIPMIIYALIFNMVPLYKIVAEGNEITLSTLLYPIYMLPFICVMVIMNLGYTEQGNLLWIYTSRPLEHPGALLLGSLKAIYFKYFFPFLLIIYTIYGILTGLTMLSDLVLAFSFSTLYILLYYRYSNMVFPFTKEKSNRESGGIIVKMFGTILLLILLGVCHHLLTLIPWGVTLAIPISWILIYWSSRRIFSIPLAKIQSHY